MSLDGPSQIELLERIAIALEAQVADMAAGHEDTEHQIADHRANETRMLDLQQRQIELSERRAETEAAHVALHMQSWQDAHPGREPWTLPPA